MTLQTEKVAHKELVDYQETLFHTHPKHSDAGDINYLTPGTWKPISFNETFPTIPVVIVTGERPARIRIDSITQNGFLIRSNRIMKIFWFAREKGYR
jgi:hypothetical protein